MGNQKVFLAQLSEGHLKKKTRSGSSFAILRTIIVLEFTQERNPPEEISTCGFQHFLILASGLPSLKLHREALRSLSKPPFFCVNSTVLLICHTSHPDYELLHQPYREVS